MSDLDKDCCPWEEAARRRRHRGARFQNMDIKELLKQDGVNRAQQCHKKAQRPSRWAALLSAKQDVCATSQRQANSKASGVPTDDLHSKGYVNAHASNTRSTDAVHIDVRAVALNVASMVQTGPRFRVTKVRSNKLLEIACSRSPVSLADFWPSTCPFSAERRTYLYWAIACSSCCDTWTLSLALAFKELSDHGIILTYERSPVANVVVLYTPTMDISDLLSSSVELLEPVSGARIPLFSTPASQLALNILGPEIQERLGYGVASMFDETMRMQLIAEFGEKSLTNTVPHWWVAAVVRGDHGLFMVHIDLCGPAYGAFCNSTKLGKLSKQLPVGEKEVPMDVFITPLYLMVPAESQQEVFYLHPDAVNFSPADAKFTAHDGIRHLRCLHSRVKSCMVLGCTSAVRAQKRNDRGRTLFWQLLDACGRYSSEAWSLARVSRFKVLQRGRTWMASWGLFWG
eukprot:TRINITY_DN5065_c0_g3_i2.p1 TRINITY_DN5065_c0_g3~~TRINITY_DN5065_c0_g3_i2.p1  ORF type:complete len:458 (-),score=54.57 TRINITY_DN5065_c0_g3_i2:241-1614(-)